MWCAPSNSSGSSGLGPGGGRTGGRRRRTPGPGAGGRLNLLLSDAGWRQEGWAEGLPRLLEPLGVRSWRVQTGQDAARLLQAEPIHIAVVDLSLPLEAAGDDDAAAQAQAEGGQRLLQLLSRLETPPPTIVIKRPKTSRDDARELACALRLGAFAVVDRPVQMELILEVFRRVLRRHYAGRWPGEGRTPPPSGSQWV